MCGFWLLIQVAFFCPFSGQVVFMGWEGGLVDKGLDVQGWESEFRSPEPACNVRAGGGGGTGLGAPSGQAG